MGRSRRKYKKSRPKVRVGLLKKKPGVFKPAFTIPDKLLSSSSSSPPQNDGNGEIKNKKKVCWDDEGSVLRNYRSFGVLANPNLLGARARTPQILQCSSLQIPRPVIPHVSEFEPIDGGSDLESDDVKSALGKRRRDGKAAPPQPLRRIQRVHIGRLVEKYGDDYQAMFMDTKLNAMQHSVGTLQKLCKRFFVANTKAIL